MRPTEFPAMKNLAKLLIPILSTSGFAAEPLQSFTCSGSVVKEVAIYEDVGAVNGRRINQRFYDDSAMDWFTKAEQKSSYVLYQKSGSSDEIRHYGAGHLEYWDSDGKIDSMGTCLPFGPSTRPTGKVIVQEKETYGCEDGVITITMISTDRARIQNAWDDGSGSEGFFQVSQEDGYTKLIGESDRQKELSDWGKAQGVGFSGAHKRIIGNTLQSWSQGGGSKLKPPKMYDECTLQSH